MLRRLVLALALALGAFMVAPNASQATPLGATLQTDVAAPAKAEKAYYVYRYRYYRPRYRYYRRYYRPRYYSYRPRYYRRYYY